MRHCNKGPGARWDPSPDILSEGAGSVEQYPLISRRIIFFSVPNHSATPDGRPICTFGAHVIGPEDYFYTVNPIGGYGRDEVLCCEACIWLAENDHIRQRMLDAGAVELGSRSPS